MALIRKSKPSFADQMVAWRIADDEPLLLLDKVGKETGLWKAIETELRKAYSPGGVGRPAYDPLSLFKCLLLELMFNLSDEGLIRHLRYNLLLLKFAGFSLDDQLPDPTTLVKFRTRLVEAGLDDILQNSLSFLNRKLKEKGVSFKAFVIDATLVEVQNPQDPDARWGIKGRKAKKGFKAHLSTDAQRGAISKFRVTPANVHDSRVFEELFPDGGEVLIADKGYDSEELRGVARERGIEPYVPRRRPRGSPGFSRAIYSMRRVIERSIAHLKERFGLRRARWRGLKRFALQVGLAALLLNLHLFLRL